MNSLNNLDSPSLSLEENPHPAFQFLHTRHLEKTFAQEFPQGLDLQDLPSCKICQEGLMALQEQREQEITAFLEDQKLQDILPKKVQKQALKHLKKFLADPLPLYFQARREEAQRYHESVQNPRWIPYPKFCSCETCNQALEAWKNRRLAQIHSFYNLLEIKAVLLERFTQYCLYKPLLSPSQAFKLFMKESPKNQQLLFPHFLKLFKKQIFPALFEQYSLPHTSFTPVFEEIPEDLQTQLVDIFLKKPPFRACIPELTEALKSFVSRYAAEHPELIALEKERKEVERRLELAVDMKSPHLYYQSARKMYRDIIFHIGPTNAGKTHHAFEALRLAKNGQYLAPLRLLAQEGQDKLLHYGVRTSLLTGEERDILPEATHLSSTIEMADLHHPKEVAVIDEIQMINDEDRGWAWTRALLGFPAKEIHLCGTAAALPLVQRLVELCGDFLRVQYYERLTPLHVTPEPVSLDLLETGDALIAFSRKKLHDLKYLLKEKGFSCSMVYGALPPEVRRRQAELFNKRKNQILLATDAIGMGLNLNINRIIFWELEKYYNLQTYQISPEEILQIGGRAGRYGFHEVGYVAGAHRSIHRSIEQAFHSKKPKTPQLKAGLKPELSHILALKEAAGYGDLPSLLLEFSHRASTDDSLYKLCRLDDMIQLAHKTHANQSLEERFIFCCAPVDLRKTLPLQMFQRMVQTRVSQGQIGLHLTVPTFSSSEDGSYLLESLEEKVKTIDVYLWLAYRYPENFNEIEKAIELRKQCSERINDILSQKRLKHKKKKDTGREERGEERAFSKKRRQR